MPRHAPSRNYTSSHSLPSLCRCKMPPPRDLSFNRTDSPVPPPMPSPQLKPMPLPSPPAFTRRPQSSVKSRERPSSRGPKTSQNDTELLVFSLKTAIVVDNSRRYSDNSMREKEPVISQRPRTAGAELRRGSDSLPSSSLLQFKREHRRSDSITQAELPPAPHSLSKTRFRSPSRRSMPPEAPPPVPPLPPLISNGSSKRTSEKRLPPPIRIPELGLGIDDRQRSPLSTSSSSCMSPRGRPSKDSETSSFFHLSKRDRSGSKSNLSAPLPGCMSLRPSNSLPDIKESKRRSGHSIAARILRLGTQAH